MERVVAEGIDDLGDRFEVIPTGWRAEKIGASDLLVLPLVCHPGISSPGNHLLESDAVRRHDPRTDRIVLREPIDAVVPLQCSEGWQAECPDNLGRVVDALSQHFVFSEIGHLVALAGGKDEARELCHFERGDLIPLVEAIPKRA